jgi:hypothetical protein
MADEHRHTATPPAAPIVAPAGQSPATASRPDTVLEDARYHIYESNPAPWWIAVLWLAFFVFGFSYLILNLLK